MTRTILKGGAAAAALAIGLLSVTGALAETPAAEEPVLAPGEQAEAVVPLASEPAAAESADPAVALEPEPATAGEAVAATAEPAAVDAMPGAVDPIAEQLSLLLGPDAPASAYQEFYATRGYEPAWVDADGLNANGDALVAALAGAAADGLHSEVYLNEPILARLEAIDLVARAELDVLLSDAFSRFGNDLMNGRFRQREENATTREQLSTMDLTQPMRYALETGQVTETLQGMAPPHEQYRALRQALAEYQALAASGGWPTVPDTGVSLEQGQRGSAISALRARLAASGDYVPPADGQVDDTYYDAGLAEAVRTFQAGHGLLDDAVVGPRTLSALNASMDYRIQQIEASMERWRWYPRDLGAKHIMVNVPAFTLRAVDPDQELLTMRVVVGTPEHQTPIFNDRMEYSQLNPYWNVPQSIADNEYLPALRSDPFHLLNQNIRILSGGQEVNPVLVDWSSVGGRFPYVLRQEPGSGNALGRIKFMFPNRHAVYMHDTPQRHLFSRSARSFSHGCIRLQDPMAMAGFVFHGRYTAEQVEDIIASGRTRDIILDEHIPVYIAYFTAAVGENGEVAFFNDVYNRDRELIAAMVGSAPDEPELVAENVRPEGLN